MGINDFDFRNKKWELSFEGMTEEQKKICKKFLDTMYPHSTTPSVLGLGFSNTDNAGVLNTSSYYWISGTRSETLGCAKIVPKFKVVVGSFTIEPPKTENEIKIEELETLIKDAQDKIQQLKESI